MFSAPPILGVTDNAKDVLLLERAFATSQVVNPLVVVRTSQEALAYVGGAGGPGNGDRPLPSLVLLDLKMGESALELLRWIRQHESKAIKDILIVGLTDSRNFEDLHQAQTLGVDAFLIKPLAFERFSEFSQACGGHWLWLDKAPCEFGHAGSGVAGAIGAAVP